MSKGPFLTAYTPGHSRKEYSAVLTDETEADRKPSTTRHKRKRDETELQQDIKDVSRIRRRRTSSVPDTGSSSSTRYPASTWSGISRSSSSSSDAGFTYGLYPEALRTTPSATSGFALSLPNPPDCRGSSACLAAPVENLSDERESNGSNVFVVFGEDIPRDLPESHLLFLEIVCQVNSRLYGRPRLELSEDTTEPSYSETRKAVIVTNLFSTLARVEYKAEL
jgi:hypothetical protein